MKMWFMIYWCVGMSVMLAALFTQSFRVALHAARDHVRDREVPVNLACAVLLVVTVFISLAWPRMLYNSIWRRA